MHRDQTMWGHSKLGDLQVRREASQESLALGLTLQEQWFWFLNHIVWDFYAREAIAHLSTARVLLTERDGPSASSVLHSPPWYMLQSGLGWNFTSQLLLNSMFFALYLQNPNFKDVNHEIQKQILFCLPELGFVWWPLTKLKNQRGLYATSKSSVWNAPKPKWIATNFTS